MSKEYLRREGRQVSGLRGVRCGSPSGVYLLFWKFLVAGLLYGKSVVPALESDCRKSDCVFHVSDHLLHLFISVDRY